MTEHMDTCASCRFYAPLPDQVGQQRDGQCRRHAPGPKLWHGGDMAQASDTAWPCVEAGDWCGEYEPKRG